MQKLSKSRIAIFSIFGIFAIFLILLYAMGYDAYFPAIQNTEAKVANVHSSIENTNSIVKETQDSKPNRTLNKTASLPTPPITPSTDIDWSNVTIDKVEVYKSKRRIDLIDDNKVVRSYPIRLGFTPEGHKTTEGDGKTPEGKYTLDWRNPKSQFYKSLHISYPNQADIAQARLRGVSAGGDIMIHGTAKKTGGSKGQPFYDYLPRGDWTLGCVSVSNQTMDEVWNNVQNGTPIEIFP